MGTYLRCASLMPMLLGLTGRHCARLVLSLDLEADLKAARRAYDARLARARGMTRVGYRLLLKEPAAQLTDRIPPDADGVTHYDSRSDRPLTSSLSFRTISVVLRMSASLRSTPIVDAIATNRALNSR
jgi:hypothetical protein